MPSGKSSNIEEFFRCQRLQQVEKLKKLEGFFLPR